MKKPGLILLLLLGSLGAVQGQSFLAGYRRHMRQNRPHEAWVKRARQTELQLLAKLFAEHQRQTGRQFDTADTVHILTTTPVEVVQGYAPTAGMIWNATDTISFRLQYADRHPFALQAIHYEPFLVPIPVANPFANFSYDSLVTLVSRRQLGKARRLAADHPVLDGSRSQVVSAVRTPTGYQITESTLPAFGLLRRERKQP